MEYAKTVPRPFLLGKLFATVLGAAVFGGVVGAIVAYSVLLMWLGAGPPSKIHSVASVLGWAVFFGIPGVFLGLAIGIFLVVRARNVLTFRRLLLESVCLCALLSIGTVQVFLPIAWEPPRVRIALLTLVVSSVLAMIGTLALRPLYWPNNKSVDFW